MLRQQGIYPKLIKSMVRWLFETSWEIGVQADYVRNFRLLLSWYGCCWKEKLKMSRQRNSGRLEDPKSYLDGRFYFKICWEFIVWFLPANYAHTCTSRFSCISFKILLINYLNNEVQIVFFTKKLLKWCLNLKCLVICNKVVILMKEELIISRLELEYLWAWLFIYSRLIHFNCVFSINVSNIGEFIFQSTIRSMRKFNL